MQQTITQQPLFIQGDLQAVFDALYELGIIEPVLAMDWKTGLREIEKGAPELVNAVHVVNRCGVDRVRLKNELANLDRLSLEYLAMEVAREYAVFHTRDVSETGLQ